MRYWKFSQKSKLKQKFFTDSEKEVGNFFATGTIVVKYQFLYSYLMLLTTACLVSDDFQTF